MKLDPESIINPDLLANPYPFYEKLRAEAPVWKVPGLDLAYVASHEHIAEALKRVEDFSNHLDVLVITGPDGLPTLFHTSELGDGTMTLATADPPDHTRHRNLVFPELVAKRMTNVEARVEAFVQDHIAAARASGSQVDWAGAVANPVPARTIGHVIGLPDKDWPQVMGWALNGTALLAGVNDTEAMAAYGAEAADAGGYLATKLIQAAEQPADDLVGVCAQAVVDGHLAIEEAVGTLVILLGAGGESTASLIGNAVRILADQPQLQEQLRSNPSLVEPFIEEALRLESPFKGHFRQVRQDCSLGGVELASGTTVLLLWASANRDATEHQHPDQVDLERRVQRSHLAFGRGIHHCVGAALARMEASIALRALLEQSTGFTLNPDHQPSWEPSLFVRRHATLPLQVDWV